MVHKLPSLHTTGVPPQLPLAQVSAEVHALPSLQAIELLINWQPLAASQLSDVQALLSLHTTALPAAHLPSAHASPLVQTVPSSQGKSLLLLTHPLVGSQESLVQALLSLQFFSDPAAQLPPLHKSPIVHTLLSLHTAALLGKTQPLTGSQASFVQGLPSLQASALPGAQLPHCTNPR